MNTIENRLREINDRIAAAANGRSVVLIAVTKTVDAARIREAAEAGARIFGENRIQEALRKQQDLQNLDAEWHFIGHLQTNKARDAVKHFRMIQSVDSERLLNVVDKEAGKLGKVLDVLLEVNLGGEESKSGTTARQLPSLLHASRACPHLRVAGLMTVPPFLEDPEAVRPYFQQLRQLRDAHQADYPGLQQLSMGMSHDYVAAVEEGATMVRIGTALFGARN